MSGSRLLMALFVQKMYEKKKKKSGFHDKLSCSQDNGSPDSETQRGR